MSNMECVVRIMITCPCNVYPLTPHSYIVKLGFTGVYIFSYFCSKDLLWVHVRTASLFLLQNINCGYSLELPNEAVLTCTHNLCFEQKYEKSKKKINRNYYFYSREKSLPMYVARACFRNSLYLRSITAR